MNERVSLFSGERGGREELKEVREEERDEMVEWWEGDGSCLILAWYNHH